jgi:ribosomal protein S18
MGDVRFFLEFLEKQMKMTPLEFRGLDSKMQREVVRAFTYWKTKTFG